jgi:uroporphyrinogen decarboxylase
LHGDDRNNRLGQGQHKGEEETKIVTAVNLGGFEQIFRDGGLKKGAGDDVSTQLDMMISPALWREMLKPRLLRVIQTAKSVNPETLVFYHGDGNLQTIIPDLIEIGVDILNPVQPECMDPVKIKERYGERLSFWGTIGTQTTLPFGTAADIEKITRTMIETVGAGGGLLLAPTHVIEPDVPWENIEALVAAIKKYGVY